MAEQAEAQIDNVSSAEEIAQARAEGWVDGPDYRGTEGRPWIPAKEFLAKGKNILPIVQKKLEEALGRETALTARVAAAEAAGRAQEAAIAALQESAAEDAAAQVEAAKAELKDAMAAALEAGDHTQVAELTGKMVKLETAEQKAAKKPNGEDTNVGTRPIKLHPEVQSWFDSHKAFLADPRKVGLSNAIAAEMRIKGDVRGMKQEPGQMAAFLDDVMQETETALAGGQRRGGDGKTESSNGGGGRGNSDEKSYDDLPAEAKAACDSAGKRLIGPGRAHKNQASWRASYVKQFFKS